MMDFYAKCFKNLNCVWPKTLKHFNLHKMNIKFCDE